MVIKLVPTGQVIHWALNGSLVAFRVDCREIVENIVSHYKPSTRRIRLNRIP
jgi:hypothetical protein